MKITESAAGFSFLQYLPSVDRLLRTETGSRLAAENGAKYITALSRRVIDDLRDHLLRFGENGPGSYSETTLLAEAEQRLNAEFVREKGSQIRRVINATGVMIHTNLGRAPLSENARQAMVEAGGYATVEYDLAAGARGKRGSHAEMLVCEMTGAEAAVIVNNCAAAAFLVLTVFASGGEVVVSRGELVEIGGDFRIPDVLTQSGARLSDVGTTNRTRLADYERAVNEETRMILKVHPSNYRIIGFSAAAKVSELVALATRKKIIFYEDAGSGALIDVGQFGLRDEPVIAESIAAGVDLVTFSGDKLLGGPQAGIIAGKKDLIEKIRKHPLYRVLRVDKIAYAALEATLESFRKERSVQEIPVLRMLAMSKEEISKRCILFLQKLKVPDDLKAQIIEGKSAVGGGASPDFQPETTLLALKHSSMTAERLEYALRHAEPPVIARIDEGKVLLDLRTVAENEEAELVKILSAI